MNHKVNLQARIKRHSRILKDNLGNTLHHSSKKSVGPRIVALLIVLMFPVYPAFSSYVYSNTQLDFDRGDIDESSILSSYDETPMMGDSDTLFEAKDSYLSVGALVEDDTSGSNKLISYEGQEGDTIELIAKKYGISKETIIWENNFGPGHLIKKGEKIVFPPVTGVTYIVKRGETVSGIAQKYDIPSKHIAKQNLLTNNAIHPGQKLIIPGGQYIKEEIKKAAPVIAKKAKSSSYTSKKANTGGYSFASSKSSVTSNKGTYKLKWRKPYSGVWGNCTYYVASYKNVNWRGNANQWLYRAKAKGHATGKNATLGAIIVFQGRGYNPRYGHVGIVMEVQKNHLIVSDMNYRRLGQVTYRKINRWDSSIKGYIYVGD